MPRATGDGYVVCDTCSAKTPKGNNFYHYVNCPESGEDYNWLNKLISKACTHAGNIFDYVSQGYRPSHFFCKNFDCECNCHQQSS